MADPLMERLAGLPAAEADAGRRERLRQRCHARLARDVRRRQKPRHPWPLHRAPLAWQPLVASLAFVYLATALVQALELYGP